MNCPRCQAVNPDEARFCLNCGKPLAVTCPVCGTTLAPEAKFCHNCGHSLAQPAPLARPGGEWNDLISRYLPKEFREPGRALPYLVQAGDQAARAYSAPEASAYYNQALEILSKMEYSDLARRAYQGEGRVLSLSNESNKAVENYQSMYQYGQTYGDDPMQVSALNKLSDVVAFQFGQFPEAEKRLADAEHLARQHNDRAGLAEHYMVRCGMCTAAADFDGAVHYLSEAVQIGRELEQKEQLAFGLAHIVNTMTFMTRFEDAWQAAQEGLQVSEEIGHREHKADILVVPVAVYHMRNGDLEAAYRAALEGTNIGEQIGSINYLVALRIRLKRAF